ncbi:RNA polymerase sigma factor [Streptomyces bobili]|uniref:RNA polymerase sigma factor n=1 Tax=Streptomyces bobili TaxID=67280 RepID=UPI0037140F77
MSDAETPAWVAGYYVRSKTRLLARLHVLRAHELVDDLLQSAFMKLIVKAREGLTFETDQAADAYVFMTCKNEYIDSMRGPRGDTQAAATEMIEPHLEAVPSAEDSYLDIVRMINNRRTADHLLENLATEHRYHLELWASGDFMPSEIATLIGKTSGAERTQRHRLLKRLRGTIERAKEAGK